MRPLFRAYRYLAIQGLLAGSLLASGCATVAAPPTPPRAQSAASSPASPPVAFVDELPPGFVPVVRQGRYTLVEMVPETAQRDLMQQLVDIAIPPTFDVTVGDALRYVLLRSGYQLCDSSDAASLYGLPLPAAQLHLGPLSLRDALLTLAGPAWDLSIDEANRQVCFGRHAEPAPVHSGQTAAPTEPAASPATSSPDPIPFDDPLQPWEVQP
ncbi:MULTISPECIES: PFGI-1 class ICE element type IV pilus protein PilL2 [Pseudomonadota]|uniref:PFGI-1 class ICE element type IV pilus protein PilL2 n=1 Tax=Pseudomonadota TaxID=1224 RepID=UPI0003BB23C3|nr:MULTISPECIES: PilL N-terminal domain-containing protein [Pseudomonadota]ERY96114.1 integrating conjugative element protein PilL, PFGI-1 class [Pseudomonas aeruginosa BWHPSA009]